MRYGNLGDGITSMVIGLAIIACVSVPLALWKLWEIGAWFFSHVTWQ